MRVVRWCLLVTITWCGVAAAAPEFACHLSMGVIVSKFAKDKVVASG